MNPERPISKLSDRSYFEKKLQHELIMWFSQKYPHLRGCLFEVNNTVTNIRHASNRRSMGMISGVSDLVFFNNNIMLGIEMKAPGSVHSIEKILNQLNWGLILINQGGSYIMSSKIDDIKKAVEYTMVGIKVDIRPDIDLTKRTVKF